MHAHSQRSLPAWEYFSTDANTLTSPTKAEPGHGTHFKPDASEPDRIRDHITKQTPGTPIQDGSEPHAVALTAGRERHFGVKRQAPWSRTLSTGEHRRRCPANRDKCSQADAAGAPI